MKIVPTFNSNGVSVINATSSNKNLTLSLRAPLGGFTYGGNPFSVGDEIFVENIQVKLIPEGLQEQEQQLWLVIIQVLMITGSLKS